MLRSLLCFCFCILLVGALPPSRVHLEKKSTQQLETFQKRTFSDVHGRIINGQLASLGQFPWHVQLLVAADDFAYVCGGALISDQWIVTAAQCIEKAYMTDVYMGAVDYNLIPMISLAVTFIQHEEYDASLHLNDIGLVKLRKRLLLDENTSPIALSEEPLDAGVVITVSGWGEIRDDDFANDYLYAMNVTTIENSECAQIYGEDAIPDSMVCTDVGDPASSLCSGDIGGPAIVYNADGTPVLVGIANLYDDRDCESGNPSGFTRIADYVDWIKEKTGI